MNLDIISCLSLTFVRLLIFLKNRLKICWFCWALIIVSLLNLVDHVVYNLLADYSRVSFHRQYEFSFFVTHAELCNLNWSFPFYWHWTLRSLFILSNLHIVLATHFYCKRFLLQLRLYFLGYGLSLVKRYVYSVMSRHFWLSSSSFNYLVLFW